MNEKTMLILFAPYTVMLFIFVNLFIITKVFDIGSLEIIIKFTAGYILLPYTIILLWYAFIQLILSFMEAHNV